MKLVYFFVSLILISCDLPTKKSISNGKIEIVFKVNSKNNDFENSLRSRLDFVSKELGFEYDLSERNSNYTIQFPLILNINQINNLLFSKGYLNIKINDSIYFNSNSFEKELKIIDRGVQITLKSELKNELNKVTLQNINKYLIVYIDSLCIMSPKIANPITDGILVFSPFNSEDKVTKEIFYAIIKFPYEKQDFDSSKVKLYLRDKNIVKELPIEYNIIYSELRSFILSNRGIITDDFKNLSSIEREKTFNYIMIIMNNDFYGYLVESNVKSTSELQEMFNNFHRYLKKENQVYLIKKIDSLLQ